MVRNEPFYDFKIIRYSFSASKYNKFHVAKLCNCVLIEIIR